MTMTDRYKNILQKYHVTLIADLEPESVADHLWAEKIISDDDREKILLTKNTRGKKSGILLGMLQRRGQQAFLKFVEALEIVQPFLACMLYKEEKTMFAAEIADRDQQLMEKEEKIKQLQSQFAKEKTGSRPLLSRTSRNASATLYGSCVAGQTVLAAEVANGKNHLTEDVHTVAQEQEQIQELKAELNDEKVLKPYGQRREFKQPPQHKQLELEEELAEFRTASRALPRRASSSASATLYESLTEENTMLVGEVGVGHQVLMERMEGKAKQQEKILQLQSEGTHKNSKGRLANYELQEEWQNGSRLLSSRASGGASAMLYESSTEDGPRNQALDKPHILSDGKEEQEDNPQPVRYVMSSVGQENTALSTMNYQRQFSNEEYSFGYTSDFDQNGVIYYLGYRAGFNKWVNPAREPSSGVTVTRSRGYGDAENILEYFSPGKSSVYSWWCVDLGEKYRLIPINYTLRQRCEDGIFLRNWELQGRVDDSDEWVVVSRHGVFNWRDQPTSYVKSEVHQPSSTGSSAGFRTRPAIVRCRDTQTRNVPCKTKTWAISGKTKAYRYFRIKIDDQRATKVTMSLAGIEFYGALFATDKKR